jgi:ribosomal protein S18 acetylase RimI-like enzyme
MRSLAVWTTTAAVALLSGVASAQTPAPASEPAAAGNEIQSAMSAYAAYQSDVSELRSSSIRNANELEGALDRVARHNRDQLTRGWVAYGASTAAQSPAFVQGVRDAAAYYGRDAVIWAVSVDPSYARGLRGGPEVTRMLLESANADSARIVNVAERYRELAYSIQRQRWANTVAPQQAARVQRIRSLGVTGAPATAVPSDVSPRLTMATLSHSPSSDPTTLGGQRFWDAVRGGSQVVEVASAPVTYQWRVNATRGEALDRMAAVAALQALDAVDTNQSAVTRLISDPRSRDCFEMAQLQLYQCMSAARFRYENAFCLGQHGLRDIGTCIGAVAQPDATAMSPIPTAARGGRD